MNTSSADWAIPRRIWAILLSWGVAVLMIAALLSFWIWRIDREVQREQDRAMCAMVELFTGGPPPPAGPEGERARRIVRAMTDYKKTLHCEDFATEPPVEPRPR